MLVESALLMARRTQLYHPESQDYITTLKGHRGPVLDCDISVDSLYIVSASADKTLRVRPCLLFHFPLFRRSSGMGTPVLR